MAIYRVKRFSVTKEEKSFGIIRDKLSKTISKEKENFIRRKENSIFNERLINSEVEGNIISDNSNIAAVYPKDPDSFSPYMEGPNKKRSKNIKDALSDPNNNFTEDDIKLLTLVMSRDDKDICSIYWDRCDGLESLAHELGHVKNYRGNLLDKFIRKGAKFGQKLRSLPNGVINSLLDVLGSKFINWEEKNASSKGYSMLNKYNLSREDLNLAKENMDNALEMYKSQSKISWRKKLIDSKIPQWLL